MLLAFYVHKGMIEPLGVCDTDFSGFLFSPKFRHLGQELKIPRLKGEETYSKYGVFINDTKIEGKRLYLVNTEFDIDKNVVSTKQYQTIKKAIRSYKLEQLI